MGKSNSKNADTVKLQADIVQLRNQLSETQVKAQEAQNLLRFKVYYLRTERICESPFPLRYNSFYHIYVGRSTGQYACY